MTDLGDKINHEKNDKNLFQRFKKVNIIRNLKDHKDKDKISKLIKEYNKRQQENYFLNQNNIHIGKLNLKRTFLDKNNKLIPYSFVGPSRQFSPRPSKKPGTLRQSFNVFHSQDSSNTKSKNYISLSPSRIEKQKNMKEILKINNNQIIDNTTLKNYYEDIRKNISEKKLKNKDREKLLITMPFPVKKSLIYQENIFRKNKKEKKIMKLIEERLKKKTKRQNYSELLMNRSKNFDKKNQQINIIEKCLTEENKYKDNLWNITLRNPPINGKYEKVGYFNVGNKYEPIYTFFNINRNIEYFYKPGYSTRYTSSRNKRQKKSKTLYEYSNRKLIFSLNEDNYDLKTKQKLQKLESIKNLEVNGKNLLNVEEKRETKIKGKKILLIDDSIVRGTQLRETTDFLYQSGAKEVHIRPACPPLVYGCKYLNFSRSKSEMDLITRRVIKKLEGDNVNEETLKKYCNPDSKEYETMVEEIRKELHFTTLRFHRLDDMLDSTGLDHSKLCTFCWNGVE